MLRSVHRTPTVVTAPARVLLAGPFRIQTAARQCLIPEARFEGSDVIALPHRGQPQIVVSIRIVAEVEMWAAFHQRPAVLVNTIGVVFGGRTVKEGQEEKAILGHCGCIQGTQGAADGTNFRFAVGETGEQ